MTLPVASFLLLFTLFLFFFFFNDTATTEIYTLSLHDALPIWDSAISGNDRNSLIYQAAQDVLKEGAEIITKELRREGNKRIAELEEAKAAYLAVCAKLGSIQRNAEEISNKLSSGLEGFLPASGVPRLVTAIDLEE